jgi:hypothetical protein
VLVVSGCPGTELAIARIREATESLGIETNVRFIIIDGDEQAKAHGFTGSPTVRVEGDDVEEGARDRPIGISCRLYMDGDATDRAPPLALIRAALARRAPLLGPS